MHKVHSHTCTYNSTYMRAFCADGLGTPYSTGERTVLESWEVYAYAHELDCYALRPLTAVVCR